MANDIERKALELVNEMTHRHTDAESIYQVHSAIDLRVALCRAIERHEAFRQEVSDAVEERGFFGDCILGRFIIAKPDPLAKLIDSIAITLDADDLRAALDEAGLEIREKRK